jgi:hypothetical protein
MVAERVHSVGQKGLPRSIPKFDMLITDTLLLASLSGPFSSSYLLAAVAL